MPGYEIYHEDGTLLVRCRREEKGKNVEIPEKELLAMTKALMPMPKVLGPLPVKIITLTDDEYQKSKIEQAKSGMPKFDGSRESKESRLNTIAEYTKE